MPGRERLQEIVYEQTARARLMGETLDRIAKVPREATKTTVGDCARRAHEAIDRAADACEVLVKEG